VDPPNHGSDQMNLISNGGSGVEAIYYDHVASSLKHASRASATASWGTPTTLDLSGQWPSIVRGANGNLHVAPSNSVSALQYRLRVGNGWTPSPIEGKPSPPEGNCWITLDRLGNPLVAYVAGGTLKVRKKVVKSWTDIGATVTAAANLPHHVTLRADANADV